MENFLSEYWQYIVIIFYVAEKVVLLTPAKWDDIIISALVSVAKKLVAMDQKRRGETYPIG